MSERSQREGLRLCEEPSLGFFQLLITHLDSRFPSLNGASVSFEYGVPPPPPPCNTPHTHPDITDFLCSCISECRVLCCHGNSLHTIFVLIGGVVNLAVIYWHYNWVVIIIFITDCISPSPFNQNYVLAISTKRFISIIKCNVLKRYSALLFFAFS